MKTFDNILNEIYAHKVREVEERRSLYPSKLLERSIYFPTQPVSLKDYIRNDEKSGIIAEYKTRSPSKGLINDYAGVAQVTLGYMQAGASALSILTDHKYFGGSLENLKTARRENYCPILQKDFIVEDYQILEAKAYGADAILLIAALLSKRRIRELTRFARELELEVLLEIHDASELEKIHEPVDLVGINNRNLKTFDVHADHSLQLAQRVPDDFMKIAESGIHHPQTAYELLRGGFEGLLIGEAFMKHLRPGKACANFIRQLKSLNQKQNPSSYESQGMRIER
ncbi:MAG: indole-3-glycerol phosphate synthase TrpC [Bacteroidales bacterium]|nr:indole-3-glycerol phosphate synthase TrpC [Bacteroidales bacterium]